MRILEARDGFIKFETEEKVAISTFLQIDGFKRYIAQIIKISNFKGKNIGYAKLIFIYDGSISEYDNSLPDINSMLAPLDFSVLNELNELSNPITSGYFIQDEVKLSLEKNCFDKKMLISIDNAKNCNKLVYSFKQRFLKSQNVLIIDLSGIIEGKKYYASKDFKLPLNYEALKFLYEDCLNDATSDSKGLIKEIFADLAEYSKSVPFLPFSALKNIIDDMVNNSHVFKLIVLKNKLAKFDKLNYFANNTNDVENINKILSNKDVIIDLSKLDSLFQNRYLEEIFNSLSELDEKPQVFITTSNLITKKSLKTILNSTVSTTLVSNSHFRYINEIKSFFKNFIIEPSFTNNEVFKTYKTFLENMPTNTYLIVGEGTKYIPLVSFNKDYIEELEQNFSEETHLEDNRNYEQLAQDLDLSIEKDEQTQAIEKKSEDLIEKITENLEQENITNIEIFEEESSKIDEASSDNEDNNVEITTSTEEHTDDNSCETGIVEISNEVNLNNLDENNDISENTEAKIIENSETEEINETVEEIPIPKDIIDLATEAETEDNDELKVKISEEDLQEELETLEIEENKDVVAEVIEEDQNLDNETIVINEIQEYSENEDLQTEIQEYAVDNTSIEEIEVFDDIEIEAIEITDDSIQVDEQEDLVELEMDSLEKEIIEDVNKVYTSLKEDTITDNDLDFIDELNEDVSSEIQELEKVSEEGFEVLTEINEDIDDDDILTEQLEEVNDSNNLEASEEIEILQTKESTTTSVPVYDADIPQEDLVESDSFEQGDTVIHAKYGTGIVEKMIKYGAKTLYSINFDNVGRRLLDPTLTEIKKS